MVVINSVSVRFICQHLIVILQCLVVDKHYLSRMICDIIDDHFIRDGINET